MAKGRIAHIVGTFPSKSETFIVNQMIVSLQHEFQVLIFANKPRALSFSSQPSLLKEHKLHDVLRSTQIKMPKLKLLKLAKAFLLLIVHLKHIKVFKASLNKKIFGTKASSLKLWFQAVRFLPFKDVEIFHAHFGINGILMAQLKKIHAIKGKLVVSFYGYDTFSTQENRSEIKKRYQLLFEQCSKIIVNSNYLKDNLLLLDAPEEKIEVISVGVNTKVFKYLERQESTVFKFITVGRLIPLKGQRYGLELVKNLKNKGHKVHYTIVGNGSEYDHLKQAINHLKLSNEVTLFGEANQQDILKLLYEQHLFLMTSITDEDGRAEGQGLVIAEALATGIPAIGFDSGGVSETILNDTSGFLVPEKDIEKLTQKTEILIENHTLRKDMSLKARHFVESHFDMTHLGKRIISVYENL